MPRTSKQSAPSGCVLQFDRVKDPNDPDGELLEHPVVAMARCVCAPAPTRYGPDYVMLKPTGSGVVAIATDGRTFAAHRLDPTTCVVSGLDRVRFVPAAVIRAAADSVVSSRIVEVAMPDGQPGWKAGDAHCPESRQGFPPVLDVIPRALSDRPMKMTLSVTALLNAAAGLNADSVCLMLPAQDHGGTKAALLMPADGRECVAAFPVSVMMDGNQSWDAVYRAVLGMMEAPEFPGATARGAGPDRSHVPSAGVPVRSLLRARAGRWS